MARFILAEIEGSPRVSNVTSLSIPPWKKFILAFIKAKIEASVQSSYFVLKVSNLEPMQSTMAPAGC